MIVSAIKVIKLDEESNYFVDLSTGEKQYIYDSSNGNQIFYGKLEDGSFIEVEHNKIFIEPGGSICFLFDNVKYVIDDDHRNILIRAGYIIKDNFDEIFEADKLKGRETREEFMSFAYNVLKNKMKDNINIDFDLNSISFPFETKDYNFNVFIDTINNVVYKNQQRSEINIPIYPFERQMDKYGTIYISIFAEKKAESKDPGMRRYQIAQAFINKFIDAMNESSESSKYRFKNCIIKRKIIKVDNL